MKRLLEKISQRDMQKSEYGNYFYVVNYAGKWNVAHRILVHTSVTPYHETIRIRTSQRVTALV